MPFIRISSPKKNGKRYASLEERYRENGKVKSRVLASLGPVDGSSAGRQAAYRKAADELYREVLRENVYRYGTSRPGERYQREAHAREAFQRYMDSEKAGNPELPRSWQEKMEQQDASFECRSRMYAALHPNGSATARAQSRYDNLRAAIHAEDAKLSAQADKAYSPKGTPTPEEEAEHADRTQERAEWTANQYADYAKAANAEDASKTDSSE